jgi:hypothetical protein
MKFIPIALIALVLLPASSGLAATGRGDPIPLGQRVERVPSGAEKLAVKLTTYWYAEGLFYRKSGGSYLVVRPPIGAFVRSQPRSAVRVLANGVRYHYHDGFFYRRRAPSKFEVVRAPTGAVVESLPKNARRRIIAGKVAWWYAGVNYRPFERGGRTYYRVMGI